MGVGVVLVLHGRGILADVEDGRARLAADHALGGEDVCFVLGGRGGERQGCGGGSRGCISMLDELQLANV